MLLIDFNYKNNKIKRKIKDKIFLIKIHII